MTQIRRHLDDYEENGQVDGDYLISCHKSLEENWTKIIAVQDDLEMLDEEEAERLFPVSKEYPNLIHVYRVSSEHIAPPN
jgi:hypothetical protein